MNRLGTIPEAISSSSYSEGLEYSENGDYSESTSESEHMEYKRSDKDENSQSSASGMLSGVRCLVLDSYSYSDSSSVLIHNSRASKSHLDAHSHRTVLISVLKVIYRELTGRIVKVIIR